MNKKIFALLILGVFLLAFAPLASAGLIDSANFDSTDGEYGSYVINSYLPGWLGGGERANIKLLKNTDQCLIDCSATLEGEFFERRSLIDAIKLKDIEGNLVTSIDLSFNIGQYKDIEYNIPIYEEVCEEIITNLTNSTINIVCNNIEIDSYIEVRNELIWNNYEGEEVIGYFQLEINAKKNPNQKVDWIIEVFGEELTAWIWWNSDWNFKRLINLTSNVGNFSYLETITYDAGMKSDFGDLRFLDYATETVELNYTIESFISSTSAIVRVFSMGEDSIYMYYGNIAASTTSSSFNTHFKPISYYFLDESSGVVIDSIGNNSGTNNGATPNVTGYIATAYDFDGTNDYINLGNSFGFTSGITYSVWVNFDPGTGGMDIISKYDGSPDGAIIHTATSGTRLVFSYFVGGTNFQASWTAGANLNTLGWIHVVGTFDGTNGKIYINGILEDTINSVGTLSDSTDNINIGRRVSNSNYVNGIIDEVGIYGFAISPIQIYNLFTYTEPSFIVGSEQENQGLSTTLINPENNQNFTSSLINFNFTSIPNQITLTNATLYLWNDTNNKCRDDTKLSRL